LSCYYHRQLQSLTRATTPPEGESWRPLRRQLTGHGRPRRRHSRTTTASTSTPRPLTRLAPQQHQQPLAGPRPIPPLHERGRKAQRSNARLDGLLDAVELGGGGVGAEAPGAPRALQRAALVGGLEARGEAAGGVQRGRRRRQHRLHLCVQGVVERGWRCRRQRGVQLRERGLRAAEGSVERLGWRAGLLEELGFEQRASFVAQVEE